MVNDEKISNFWLFFLGLSAGLLACYFPRLMTSLTNVDENVVISLFNAEFMIAATVVSLIIGVSMIWFYSNTDDQAKNIFIAALALPAVLSGGINMSNLSTAATQNIGRLDDQTMELQNHLENILGIESLVIVGIENKPLSFLPSVFPIAMANAANFQPLTLGSSRSGIEISVKSLQKNHYLLLETSKDKDRIFRSLKKVKENSFGKNARVYAQNDNYYLLLSGPTTKSKALIKASKLQTSFETLPRFLVIE